ncbi:hypothetical protein C2E23DRAFT_556545 [Lenzites betulinus]|nr:hypothetical protein C2E23DRAFT_556545 [Lenzites betulinus]
MAGSYRHNSSYLPNFLFTALSCLLVLLALVNHASCLPAASPIYSFERSGVHLGKRVEPEVVTSADGTNTTVIDPATNQVIVQGSATDGGGVDFSVPAIIWLAFAFAVGAPLALVGIRLWRLTTGAGVGLATTVCIWAAFVNSLPADGLPDLVLTLITLGAFAIGFVIGVLNLGRTAGIWLLGILSGFSIGIRIVLLRPGLLIPTYVANWIILAVLMVAGLAVTVFRQRLGLVSSCASVGTFLVALGADLVINKQSGMSSGLRFLFDRNSAHYLAIVHLGYHPPVVTQAILGASLGAIPVLAFAQHKIFSAPFRPAKPEFDDIASIAEENTALNEGKVSQETKPSDTRIGTPATTKESLMSSRFSTS